MNDIRFSAAALACACFVVASGGGEAETAATLMPAFELPAASVRVEGCVVGRDGAPRATRVQAVSADGTRIAFADSRDDGVFELRVPANQVLHLSAERTALDADDRLSVRVGPTPLALGACLRTA